MILFCFFERLYTEDEKPEQYRLFVPKDEMKTINNQKGATKKPPSTPVQTANPDPGTSCMAPCAVINP